jgi:LPXTG-motif cell wall-anchored protein
VTVAAACAAVAVAMPAAIARATSTGAALTTGEGAGGASTAPARLTMHPARPAPADAHTHRRRDARRRRHRRRLRHIRPARHARTGLTAQVTTRIAGRATAHAAGDPGVTIADFHFSPATTTIHVGDTITWSNSGPSSHTATAGNGSFDTGILKKGQSASHTFTQPGTFSYVCQIHPFMHGTITVLAATTSATPATTTSSPAGATAPTPTATTAGGTPTPAGPTLPNTGFNVLGGAFAGLALLGMGTALRRTRRR